MTIVRNSFYKGSLYPIRQYKYYGSGYQMKSMLKENTWPWYIEKFSNGVKYRSCVNIHQMCMYFDMLYNTKHPEQMDNNYKL